MVFTDSNFYASETAFGVRTIGAPTKAKVALVKAMAEAAGVPDSENDESEDMWNTKSYKGKLAFTNVIK